MTHSDLTITNIHKSTYESYSQMLVLHFLLLKKHVYIHLYYKLICSNSLFFLRSRILLFVSSTSQLQKVVTFYRKVLKYYLLVHIKIQINILESIEIYT